MPNSEPPPEETRLQPALSRGGAAVRSRPRLEWVDLRGTASRVLDARVLVGSAAANGVVVRDPTVSRIHAELEPREDGLWVRDLGSRNGTYVEGLRVECARVPHAGRIRVGSTELVVSTEADPAPIELWPHNSFGPLVGASAVMRELFASLAQVARTDAPVLIQGETGTGKELVARGIHDASARAGGPFVVLDCAALPASLADSDMFGHSRGSFTGATGSRVGAFEAAEGGTLFLDEIGELPLVLQPKLLRALESGTIRRVGETSHRSLDVRVISATHRHLPRMVAEGHFREDLYFRLAVLPVTVPPLRDRREDIRRLVAHFLKPETEDSIGSTFIDELEMRPWQGNVRELRNFVTRARALGPREAMALIASEGLPSEPEPDEPSPPHEPARPPVSVEGALKDFKERWLEQGEREYLRSLLARTNRNVVAAAREAGVDRTYIYRLIRKYNV